MPIRHRHLPCLRFFLACLVCWAGAALLRPALAQQPSDEALRALPPARQVVEDMVRSGAGDRDGAARATAALDVFTSVVTGLAGPRGKAQQFTPAERARLDEYARARDALWKREFESQPACDHDNCARYLYSRCAQGYVFSAPFYRELMDRYLPPDWQARHVPRLQGQLWKTALGLPAGTRAPAEMGARLPCAGAAQAALAAVRNPPSSFEALAQQVFGPRASLSNPRFRAFLDQAAPALGIGLALLALWLLGYARQFARRVTLDAADPLQMKTSPPQDLHVATGLVLGASKGIETTTTTYTQDHRVTGTSSRSVVHDQFFIQSADGRETAVRLLGVDVAVRDGHLMSAVWSASKGKDTGPYLLLRNHTLQRSIHFDENQRLLLGVRRRYLWLTFFTLAGLIAFLALSVDWWLGGSGAQVIVFTLGPLGLLAFLAMGVAQGLATRARLRGLRRQLDERLVPELDRRAAGMHVVGAGGFSRAS